MNPFNDPTRDPRALPPAQAGLEVAQGRLPMLPEPQTLYGMTAEKETHFWDYWQVVSRRRWTILCVFLGTLLAATIYTFTVRPVYTGTVSLRIEKEPPRVLKFDEVVKEADNQQDYYQTQYKILLSRGLDRQYPGRCLHRPADGPDGGGDALRHAVPGQAARGVTRQARRGGDPPQQLSQREGHPLRHRPVRATAGHHHPTAHDHVGG